MGAAQREMLEEKKQRNASDWLVVVGWWGPLKEAPAPPLLLPMQLLTSSASRQACRKYPSGFRGAQIKDEIMQFSYQQYKL